MSLFETTQMLEQLPVPRDDAHQQVVPGRSNPYSRPEFSKGFDYSKWDNIDTDDDEEEKPLSPAKREAPVPTRAAPPAQRFETLEDAIVRARAADGWGRDGVEAVADALNLPADDPARSSVEALQTSLAQAGALEQAAALPFVVGCEPDPKSVEKVKEAYERRKATPMAGEVGARSAAETVARSEARKIAKIARCLLREPDGASRLLATGAVPSGVRGLGKLRNAPELQLATAAVNAMEKKAAERLLRAAVDGPTSHREEFLRHTPFQTELSRTAFKASKGKTALNELRSKGYCILDAAVSHEDCDAIHNWYARSKPETLLPIELGLQSVRALSPSLFRNYKELQPDPETQMALRAAIQALVGCAHELEQRAPELRDGLALPAYCNILSQRPEQIVAREPLWRDDDPADDAELVAYVFANPRDWDDDLDAGTLIVRDDHDVAHYLPATGGSVVLVLARCRDVEFKAPKKRHSVVLRCRYDRRRADVDVEDEDSESDEEAGSAESRAASLAAKLRARATAGGESGGTWGANGFEPDGRAVDPSQVGFTGDEREVDLVVGQPAGARAAAAMASLVQRRDKRTDINNRRQYLQLFACQRAAPLYRWWYSLAIDTKHDLLKSWGIPERPINEPNPRFPAHFHVDALLEADDQAPVTQPPLYAPLDGVLRTFAIVADPLTRWAPRVSDESVDWLDTLTAICEALADEYVDRTLDDGASPVMLPSKVSERVREHWLPESWDRAKLQRRFYLDETLTDVACPASRSLRRHRDALCLAHRKDSVRALEQALALGLCEDDDDRGMVASALALLADSVAWTSQGFLTEREAKAVAAAGEKVYERIASYSAHCRPHQLLFLKALCLLQKQTANVAETFGDFFVLADDEAQMLHRTYASDDRRAQDRGATILVAVARAHIAFGIAKGDEDGGVERALAMRDWEIDVGCGWHARRGLRRFRRGDDGGALQDLDRALCGLSPDDAEFAACCAILAILMKRAGDEGRGARYLEVAKHGGACPELELAREAFGEASAADAEPDGVTRIVGSRVPKVLRTPRPDDLVDEARE